MIQHIFHVAMRRLEELAPNIDQAARHAIATSISIDCAEKEKAFGDGFDAGQNEALSYIGPMLDEWDRLSNDEKAEVQRIAPAFVQKLSKLRQTMDRK